MLRTQVFLLTDREVNFDGINLRNRSKANIRSNQVADLHFGNAGNAVHQRGDFGPSQIELRALDRRLCRFDGCLCRELGLDFCIQLGFGDGLLFCQWGIAFDVESSSA